MDISFNLRKLRRSIAALSMLALLATASIVPIAKAQTFSDVSAGAWYYEYVEDLAAQGAISGYDDGTFGPGDYLTRSQAAKVMVLGFIGETDADYDAGFTDLAEGAWYTEYVNTAAMYGIVSGYTDEEGEATGEFGPDDLITRAAFAKMVVNAGGLETYTPDAPTFSDVEEGAWYYEYVETAYYNSVIDGYDNGTFMPGDNVNRAEAAKMVVNGQNPEPREEEEPAEDECADGYTWDEGTGACLDENGCEDGYEWDADLEECTEVEVVVPDSDGTLTVEMGDAIAGSTVPKGATHVSFLNLTFTATGDAVELDGFTLHRTGVGSYNDFANVYVYNGTERLTSGKTIASDNNEVTFGSLNIDLAAGESVTLTIVADIAASGTSTTGNENALEVVSVDNIDSNALEATGTFPITGGTFSISGASSGGITITKQGSVPNPTIGEPEAEIAEFQLTAATEDQAFQSIALTVKGTIANDALTNLTLWQGSDAIATATEVTDDDLVTFAVEGNYDCDDYGYTGDGYCIGRGNNRTFNVTADIGTTADPADTIRVYLDESTDLVSEGLVYGYGAVVTYTQAAGYDNATNDGTDASWSTVQGGQVTVTQDGPTATDVAINSKDVLLSQMTFTSERNIEIKTLGVNLTATGSGLVTDDNAYTNFSDVKLVRLDEDGNVVETLMGPSELSASGNDLTAQTLTFTDSWNMDEDEEVIVGITCDVANYASLDGSTIVAQLNAISTSAGIKDRDTNEYITDIVPSVAVAGKTMTIRAASVTVSLASEPVSENVVKGTDNVNLATFALTVGSAMDVTITQILIQGYLDEDGDGDYNDTKATTAGTDNSVDIKNIVPTVWLEDGNGNEIAANTEAFSGGVATFSGLAWELEGGNTYLLEVYGNIGDSAYYNTDTDAVAVDLATVATNLTIEDEEGNTVTPTGNNPNGAEDSSTVVMTAYGAGTIAFAAAPNKVSNQVVAAGEEDVLVGRFKVTTTLEDWEVDKLTFTATGYTGEAASTTFTTPACWLNCYDYVKDNIASLTLRYPDDLADPDTLDGEMEVAMSGTNVTFDGLDMMAPKDDVVYIELYADFTNHTEDSGGADSDDAIMFRLNTGDADGGNGNSLMTVTAPGSGSGTTAEFNADVTLTNLTYVYRTLPTVANDTSIGSSLVLGEDVEIYRFSVSAHSNEDIILQYLTLDVSPTGIVTGMAANSLTNSTGSLDNISPGYCGIGTNGVTSALYTGAPWFIKEYGQSEIIGTGCYDPFNGYAKFELNLEDSTVGSTSGITVKAGTTTTLSVYADIYDADTTAATEQISIRLHEDSTHFSGAPLANLKGTNQDHSAATGLIWSDRGHPEPNDGDAQYEATWYLGYKVPGMPVSYVTLS